MRKQLFLIRHAEAANKSAYQTDKERELTSKGVQQSFQVGAYLVRENFNIDVIYSSSAERAMQTASMVGEVMKIDLQKIFFDEGLYDASVRTFLDFITKIDNSFNQVICVGHNPALSYIAEFLTKAEIGDMMPASVAVIRFELSGWSEVSQGNGELLQYFHPDMLTTN